MDEVQKRSDSAQEDYYIIMFRETNYEDTIYF
jgi:hypothetical protein